MSANLTATQDLKELQAALGHSFSREELLLRALTHSSLAYEQALEARQPARPALRAPHGEDNEQLEFLGDAVLGLAVAEILFRRFPDCTEGAWTRLRASLVSRRHVGKVAAALNLGHYLRLGRGEERSGGRKKSTLLANALEAVIAALYLDGGFTAAERFIGQHIVTPYLGGLRQALDAGASLEDHKSALQELLQARQCPPPQYSLKAENGPSHRKRFLVEVRIPPHANHLMSFARGIGTTKKKAEQEAARRAFEKLHKKDDIDTPDLPAETEDA